MRRESAQRRAGQDGLKLISRAILKSLLFNEIHLFSRHHSMFRLFQHIKDVVNYIFISIIISLHDIKSDVFFTVFDAFYLAFYRQVPDVRCEIKQQKFHVSIYVTSLFTL